jgi:putative ABC transport system permease protein
MRFLDLLSTASSNLLRSKTRTILTIIAIFIGAMTLTLTNGIGTGIKSYLNSQLGNLGATNVLFITRTAPSSSPSSGPAKYSYNANEHVTSSGRLGDKQYMLASGDLNIIRSINGLTDVSAAHSPSPDYIQGTGDKYQVSMSQQYGTSTTPMVAGNVVSNTVSTNQVSVPQSYVAPLGYSSNAAIIDKTVTLGVSNAYNKQSTVTATVTGVQQVNLLGQSTLYANNNLTNQLQTIQDQGIPPTLTDTFETAYATFPSNYTAAQINSIKSQLSKKGYTGQTIKDKENSIFSAINAVIIILDIFGIIALLAASFGIVNTLLMSVQERTKEIGLMKALGMGRARIFTLFSIEAVLIGFWGSLLGVGFAALVGKIVNAVGKNHFLKNLPGLSLLTFPLTTIFTVIIAIMVIAFLAGTIPAYRASKKDPIEALRYE